MSRQEPQCLAALRIPNCAVLMALRLHRLRLVRRHILVARSGKRVTSAKRAAWTNKTIMSAPPAKGKRTNRFHRFVGKMMSSAPAAQAIPASINGGFR